MCADSVAIRELRDNFTEAIRRVQRGERIEVTRDGVPVAVISPVPMDRIERLVAGGGVTRPVPLARPIELLPVTGPMTATRHSRKIALSTEARVLYADSSALVKLVVGEPESPALRAYLEATPCVLATSRIALVEVLRAVGIANPSPKAQSRATELLESCLLVDVSRELRRAASRLTFREVRTLDAVHLTSAQWVAADGVLAYDRRLADAARREHFVVHAP